MKFQNARRERRHMGNSQSKGNLNKRRLAHIERRREILLPNVGHYIQPIIPSILSKGIKILEKMEPKIPSSMGVKNIHMKKNFSRKIRNGNSLVGSGLTSWHSKTYLPFYI